MGRSDVHDLTKPRCRVGDSPAASTRRTGSIDGFTDKELLDDAVNEEDHGGRPAYLFRSGKWAAITLESSGANLPDRGCEWHLEQQFTLGIRSAAPPGIIPEQCVRSIHAHGYFVWRPRSEPRAGTTT